MQHFSRSTALSIIIANMIGTGVFTSLGFQLVNIQSGFPLIMLWVLGGMAALCGAMSYGELGAALPRSGGEYNFLARIYHPGLGFVAGFVSAIVGFAAPVALAAMTFAAYLRAGIGDVFPAWVDRPLAAGLVIALTLIHAGRRKAGSGLQISFTSIKVAAIILFCITAYFASNAGNPIGFFPRTGDTSVLTSSAFAVSLIYVSYAYTGWNAATYISGELANPQKDLPRILIIGTLIVTALYVALNAVFLLVAPIDAMVGKIEVGVIAARAAFGSIGGSVAGLTLAVLLISTVSAMTIAGPRVLQIIGEDISLLRALRTTNSDGVPSRAIYFQSGIALLFILTSSFDAILVFSGFTLAAMSFLTVFGLLVMRWREPELVRPFRVSFFPLPPLIYLCVTGWTLLFVLTERPLEALLSIGLMTGGLLVFVLMRVFTPNAA